MGDRLTESNVRQSLHHTNHLGEPLLCFEEIDSTNLYLKKLAFAGGKDGTVVIANAQTGGRGRMGRRFQSPGGKGVYLSVLLKSGLNGEQCIPFTAMAGLAVCRSVERVCGLRPGLKWPNDLLLEGKKICGILTEMVMLPGEPPAVVVGIGVNVSQTAEDFTPDVAAIAASLQQISGREVSRPQLAAALIEELDVVYDALLRGSWPDCVTDYRARCVHIGKPVRLLPMGGEAETVSVLDVDDRFGLVVRDAAGQIRVLRSGEISVRPAEGTEPSRETGR